jgi:hypothetical protein
MALLLPPTPYIEYFQSMQTSAFRRDMRNAEDYATVFPKPPKYNRKFLFKGDDTSSKQVKPPINPDFKHLLTDDPKKAGLPMGFCSLSAKDTAHLENAAAWQTRHLSYIEEINGTAVHHLKELENILAQNVPQEALHHLRMAQEATRTTVDVFENQVIPTHTFISNRLEVGRRDSYLNRLSNLVDPQRKQELRGSQFSLTSKQELFEAPSLDAAKAEIESRKSPGFSAHQTRGNSTRRFSLRKKNKKSNVRPAQQTQSGSASQRGGSSRRGTRGGQKNKSSRGNKGKKN